VVYIVNRKGTDNKHLTINTGTFSAEAATGQVFAGFNAKKPQVTSITPTKNEKNWTLELPAKSLAVLQFKISNK
jgi:hypothetical protein